MALAVGTSEIEVDAAPEVREALASMLRTEDVRFSPSGRLLAVACYARSGVALLGVEVAESAAGRRIELTSFDLVVPESLAEPHGVDFLDDETLVVADRAGAIAVFAVQPGGATIDPDPIALFGGSTWLDATGSVTSRPLGPQRHELLVCNNWTSLVTRHVLDGLVELTHAGVVARKWLDLPDGVALSDDGRWLAVSNHDTHCVLVFEYPTSSDEGDPVAFLRGVRYPHGLRFADRDRALVVADAAAPDVHVYRPGVGWHGVSYPTASIRVMSEETFARGHHNPTEGGPKGVDVHPGTSVMVVTAECLPLAFFDLEAALERETAGPGQDALLRYELHVLQERGRERDAAAATRAELRAILQTKAWRLTRPMRSAYATMLRLRSRG